MALHLRKSVMHSAVLNTIIVLGVGITSVWFSELGHLNAVYIAVLLVVAMALGGATGWLKMRRMVQSVLRSIPKSVMYARLQRVQGGAAGAGLGGLGKLDTLHINWHELDDYAVQLEALDFQHMGDFTHFPLVKSFSGVVVVYGDKNGTTLVEIQFIQLGKALQLQGASNANGIHFSIFTLLGGHIRITTTDHTPGASNYLLRSNADVLAAYPGQKLMFLMDKHVRLVQALAERTGKTPTPGLTMARYVMLQRESHFWVRSRLSGMGGYRFIHEFDRFEANPAHHWAPPSKALASLPVRHVEGIDQLHLVFPQPAIVDLASLPVVKPNTASAHRKATTTASEVASESESESAQLQHTVNRAAVWFYLIATVSLANLLASFWGSQRGFSLGLGLSHLLSDGGLQLYRAGGSGAAVFVMYAGCLGSMVFFCACGWFARKPSVFVFMVGIVLFALDTLIFVFAKDILGVALHLMVLYFLRQGVLAARILRGG